jgi:hypothetical protein
VATLNAAIAVRRRWRNGFPHLFDLHVAICPGATAQHRDATTHGQPIFFMLAARDDYTPAPLAIEYAERMRAAGNPRIKVKVYGTPITAESRPSVRHQGRRELVALHERR